MSDNRVEFRVVKWRDWYELRQVAFEGDTPTFSRPVKGFEAHRSADSLRAAVALVYGQSCLSVIDHRDIKPLRGTEQVEAR